MGNSIFSFGFARVSEVRHTYTKVTDTFSVKIKNAAKSYKNNASTHASLLFI